MYWKSLTLNLFKSVCSFLLSAVGSDCWEVNVWVYRTHWPSKRCWIPSQWIPFGLWQLWQVHRGREKEGKCVCLFHFLMALLVGTWQREMFAQLKPAIARARHLDSRTWHLWWAEHGDLPFSSKIDGSFCHSRNQCVAPSPSLIQMTSCVNSRQPCSAGRVFS